MVGKQQIWQVDAGFQGSKGDHQQMKLLVA